MTTNSATPSPTSECALEELVREMAERMLALDLMSSTFNPDHEDQWEAQLRWEVDYTIKKSERIDRNYEAWRRHRKGK